MIVYGDPSFEAPLFELVEGLHARLAASLPATSIDEARLLLVQAGQLEQAAHDGGLPEEVICDCQSVSDAAADLFLAHWSETQESPLMQGVAGALSKLELSVSRLPLDHTVLTVKLPEGFAFYALYPESYCVSALRWLADQPSPSPVLVVGIRSIGTSLSALVASTLRAAGHDVRRITVRPTGHPFSRSVSLPPEALRGVEWVLVVDEGPGLSGSSMASVAEAAVQAGMGRDRIVFFPGHGGEPGAQASPEVRAWWSEIPRYATPTEELRWSGRSLEEVLADETGPREEIESVQELTGGGWRRLAYADPAEWPAVAIPFERRKILVTLRNGCSTLWSFVGLTPPPGASPEQILRSRAEGGWAPPVTGQALGFLASPWIEGRRLTRGDVTPELLSHIGRTIASFAGPLLSSDDAARARERLEHMLFWNAREAFGEDLPLPSPSWAEPVPSYGDGRLAPHEWVVATGGSLLKTDSIGHAWDHTVVGSQPVAWDVAGAMVEWSLDDEAAAPLLAAAPPVSQEDLRFYRAAYAAFRMGVCSMSASSAPDEAEYERLRRAENYYQEVVDAILRPKVV